MFHWIHSHLALQQQEKELDSEMAVKRDFNHVIRKSPTGILPVAMDFRDRVPVGETIVGHSVTVQDENGNDATGTIIATTSLTKRMVLAVLWNGLNDVDYYVKYAIHCETARPESSVKLEVRS